MTGTDPPNGGLCAWSQVLAGHLTAFNSWGYFNSFGVFQAYYSQTLGQSPSAVSWVGGVQIFLMMFIGIFSGRAMDAGYYRPLAISGLAIQILGVFMTSLAKEYWQLLLAQGFCQGIGSGLVFTPTMAVVSSYFTTRKSAAVCGMSSGTATGGIVFPLIARQLLARVGIAWTIRIMAFVFLANAVIAQALIRPRAAPRKGGPLFDGRSFLSPWFCLFNAGMFLGVLGLYFAYFYVRDCYQLFPPQSCAESCARLHDVRRSRPTRKMCSAPTPPLPSSCCSSSTLWAFPAASFPHTWLTG